MSDDIERGASDTDTDTGDSVVLVEISQGVATVTLNRPHARNALSVELLAELPRAVRDCDERDDVHAIVLTGADPVFCAGLDLKQLGAGELGSAFAPRSDGRSDVGRTFAGPLPPISTPLIGAINGVAVTGGLELALACDFLVASERARFADTHARVGVMPAWGLSVLLPQAVGLRRAREMSVTGNYVDALTALDWGLVNHVVPHEELLEFCHRLGADIGSNDAAGVSRLLATYREGSLLAGAEALGLEADVARTWKGGSAVDPEEVERRRLGVLARGRSQQQHAGTPVGRPSGSST